MNRFDVTKKVSLLGIIGNVFLFVIKIIIGIISRSQSMIADSLNSAGDIFAALMTWIGNKISSVPNDDSHNYGHGKAEYIFSLLISISMILVSFKMLYDCTMSIINHNKLTFSLLLIIVCIITIIVKFFLYLYTKKLYKKHNNILIKANMLDNRNDCVITLFTTIAILLTKLNIYWFDGIVGICISFWIMIVGVKIFIESYNVLMDSSINNISKNKILSIIKSYKEIKRIGILYSVPIGYKYIIVLTVFIDGEMTTNESHEIIDEIENKIKSKIDIVDQVIIHIEPF